MTYTMLKKLIDNGNYIKADMLNKLDVFLMGNRISATEYNDLVAMLD